ncbi:hypothetical protein FF1_027130 [Malus domestica]
MLAIANCRGYIWMRGGGKQAELQVVRSAHGADGADGDSKGHRRCWCSRGPPPANLLSLIIHHVHALPLHRK